MMALAFEERGNGPAVVLLHGFPLDRTMWAGQIESLSDRHRVVAPDLRGHGESPSPVEPYPMEVLAEDVIESLDALGVAPPYVVGGLSMGGYVALAIAEQYPERLRGLVLMNTRAGADSPEAVARREESAATIEREGSTASLSGMVEKLLSPASRQGRPELVGRVAAMIRRTSPEGAAGALRGMALRSDRLGVIRGLRVPLLVIAGSEDAIVPEADARQMAEAASDGELVVIPGAGHLAPMEATEETNAAIRAFLGRLT